jgi:hypothetical protein
MNDTTHPPCSSLFHPSVAPSSVYVQVLATVGTILVATGLSGRQSEPSGLLQANQLYRMRQMSAGQSLFGGWSTVTPEQFDGRCRCTGFKTYNPDQRVVCACTGLPGGDNKDLWRKGPWKTLTGCMFFASSIPLSSAVSCLLAPPQQLLPSFWGVGSYILSRLVFAYHSFC